MSEMDEAHREDMQTDGRLRDLRIELEWFYETLQGQRAFKVSDAIDVLDEQRAQIVRRWD